ncbi:MAG: L-cysteine/cystine lyase [Solirubrobacteraceae bacterium]|nr:L-cysteine/cystine lyase [Solirubrobacteraceae bacterium]
MDAAALRAAFPVFERASFLNAGSDGPLPRSAVDAARASLDRALADGRRVQHFHARIDAVAALRELYAERLNAPVDQVAMTTSTSEGLAKVLVGLRLGPGDEVLTAEAEHPGLLGPLVAAREAGVTVRTGPLATLADHVTDATTVVACSHVGWSTGAVVDPRLADTGVPLVLDGAQGVGAVPTDVAALGCAAYAGAGQKWLCGADGTGMLWLEPSFAERVRPGSPPYAAFVDSGLGLESGLHPDARRYDTPSLALELLVCSLESVRVLAAFGWDALYERAAGLARALADELAARGFVVGPRGDTTLVSWEDADPAATSERLAAQGVIIRHLPGTPYVRASVGAWNDESDIDRLLEALR